MLFTITIEHTNGLFEQFNCKARSFENMRKKADQYLDSVYWMNSPIDRDLPMDLIVTKSLGCHFKQAGIRSSAIKSILVQSTIKPNLPVITVNNKGLASGRVLSTMFKTDRTSGLIFKVQSGSIQTGAIQVIVN